MPDIEVLMKICEPKRNEDSEQCIMLHNKELSDLCMSHGVRDGEV